MQLPVQVTFRGMSPSASIEAAVREGAEKLGRYFDRIMACRVVVESPHHHRKRGRLYHVRIDLTVPGEELVVSRDPVQHASHKDVYQSVHDAFDEARRQLEDYVRCQSGYRVKSHVGPPHGRVIRLVKDEGYGFLESADGREIYFHRNSVLNDAFDRLKTGIEVRFAEEEGAEGPQASTVDIVGKEGKHQLPKEAPSVGDP